ncbi:MAG: hypothetical protein KC877_02325 [Candidatus Kaiserbacteria bacterium]|nr:hypothetical protein [Candidatus Kaiserbacteria bacterium]MCB9816840.1 hypothetical protein [Candidatus Nomurabacteria bacterium]
MFYNRSRAFTRQSEKRGRESVRAKHEQAEKTIARKLAIQKANGQLTAERRETEAAARKQAEARQRAQHVRYHEDQVIAKERKQATASGQIFTIGDARAVRKQLREIRTSWLARQAEKRRLRREPQARHGVAWV